jgi:hypothetical protein
VAFLNCALLWEVCLHCEYLTRNQSLPVTIFCSSILCTIPIDASQTQKQSGSATAGIVQDVSALWSRMTSHPTNIYFGDLQRPNHKVNAISKLNRVRHRNRPASSLPVICSIPKFLPSTVNSLSLFIQFLANPSKQLDDTPPPPLTNNLSPASRRNPPHPWFPNVLVPKNYHPTLQITRQLPHHRRRRAGAARAQNLQGGAAESVYPAHVVCAVLE